MNYILRDKRTNKIVYVSYSLELLEQWILWRYGNFIKINNNTYKINNKIFILNSWLLKKLMYNKSTIKNTQLKIGRGNEIGLLEKRPAGINCFIDSIEYL